VVYRNQGHSLGRWALDMKVLDPELGKVPSLQAKREAVMGFCALLVAIALSNMATNAGAVMLMVPLALDCGFALSDNRRQAFHDHCSHYDNFYTSGLLSDIKVKRALAQLRRRVIK